MKGLFFINFMIIMSVITVVALILWSYIGRCRHKRRLYGGGVVITALTSGVLWAYGLRFATLPAAWQEALFEGSLVSLIWLFTFFLALPVLLVAAPLCAIWRLLHRKKDKAVAGEGPDLSRRRFLGGAAALVPLVAFSTSAYGIIDGERRLECTRHVLSFPNLPRQLEGYCIGQISDPHVGLFFSPARLEEAIDALAREKVDRLAITGDLIDELSLLPQCQAVLQAGADKFPQGIDYIYGNHEYYRGLERITAMLEQTPVRILRNSSVLLTDGVEPAYVAGVDYAFAKGDAAFAAERETYVQQALSSVPKQAFVVLLAHHSAFIDEAFQHHIPLTLTGHTHGGQLGIFSFIRSFGFKYMKGMFQKNGSYGYVNRGTGHWLPLRLGCSREVAVFELHRDG